MDRAVYVRRDKKAARSPKRESVFYYPTADGSPLVRVKRIDDGNGKKRIWQESINEDGQWVKSVPDEVKAQIHLYRISDKLNQRAIAQQQPLLFVEGEALVDKLLSLHIAATTSIGGAGKWSGYGHSNYTHDLSACVNLVLCPDRDKAGINHMEEIAACFPDAKWIYANPEHWAWSNPFAGSGYDLGDWIAELQQAGTDENELVNLILGAIESKREFAAAPDLSPDDRGHDHGDQAATSDLDDELEVLNETFDLFAYRYLFEEGKGDWITIDQAFYQYGGAGAWQPVLDADIQKAIADLSRKAYKAKKIRNADGDYETVPNYSFARDGNVKSAFAFCRASLSAPVHKIENRHLRAFQNCTVDMRTGATTPHDKNHFLTTAIAADYTPNQECPEAFKDFVLSAFGEDLLPVIRAVTYMFLDPTAPYGKFVHLLGPSGSGKGTMLRLWQEMFGVAHCRSANSLSELATPEGRHQNLTGVSFFQLPDVGGRLEGVKAFYELVDNGPMSGRALFSAAGYQKRWDVRFAIASVDYLRIEYSGDGWDRRVIILPTKQRSGAMDKTLETRLTDVKGEIISWAIAMPKAERDDVLGDLTRFESIENCQLESGLAGDPIQSFVDNCLRPDAENSEIIPNWKLHTWYKSFCLAHGYQQKAMAGFLSHLKNVVPFAYAPRRRATEEEINKGIDASGWIPAHYKGIQMLDGVFTDLTSEGDLCKCIKSKCKSGGLGMFRKMEQDFLQATEAPEEWESWPDA